MAKKAPAKKAPAKRKPRVKKPVVPAVPIVDPTDCGTPVEFPAWLVTGLKAVSLFVLGSLGGIWAAGGIDVSPGPGPSVNDCLAVAHAADRVSQVAVLKELASQPFDGATDDGRKQAGEWFNAQRFRNRADDFGIYTDVVSEAIAANSEEKLAAELEGK
jgi:hypothetical protein